MLGVVIGLVSTVGLLVFLQHDPVAAKKKRQEKKKAQEQREAKQEKARQQYLKKVNDPAEVQRRQQKKSQFKDKMLKGLSEDQRKLLGDYISQKRSEGKTEEQIIKEASTKAFLFICVLMFLFIICVFAIFIIWGGNEQELVNAVERVIDMGRSFVEWNFPRFANATSDL